MLKGGKAEEQEGRDSSGGEGEKSDSVTNTFLARFYGGRASECPLAQ